MFTISTVDGWLEDVVNRCNARGLDPTTSTFMLVFFTSLDFDFAEFFRTRYAQISAYSGDKFHVLTPTVHENLVISDEDWRFLRTDFERAGISMGREPTFLLFRVRPARERAGLEPSFFAGFTCPDFDHFERWLRSSVELCLRDDAKPELLLRDLEREIGKSSIIDAPTTLPGSAMAYQIEDRLSIPKAFICHSSVDDPFAQRLRDSLSENSIKAWLDDVEMNPGERIRDRVTKALGWSDYLLAVLSPASVASEWVRFELASFLAREQPGRIIPVLNGASARDLPEPLRDLEALVYVDMSTESKWQDGIGVLCEAMCGWH